MGRAALRGRGRQGVLLGLQDGAVRLYCGRSLVCVLRAKVGGRNGTHSEPHTDPIANPTGTP